MRDQPKFWTNLRMKCWIHKTILSCFVDIIPMEKCWNGHMLKYCKLLPVAFLQMLNYILDVLKWTISTCPTKYSLFILLFIIYIICLYILSSFSQTYYQWAYVLGIKYLYDRLRWRHTCSRWRLHGQKKLTFSLFPILGWRG